MERERNKTNDSLSLSSETPGGNASLFSRAFLSIAHVLPPRPGQGCSVISGGRPVRLMGPQMRLLTRV